MAPRAPVLPNSPKLTFEVYQIDSRTVKGEFLTGGCAGGYLYFLLFDHFLKISAYKKGCLFETALNLRLAVR